MRFPVKTVVAGFLVLSVCLANTCAAWADEPQANETVWKEMRSAKRNQVGKMCDLWFAAYRPSSVGKTYVEVAGQFANIDLSGCHPALRKHIKKCEARCTEIAELFAQGGNFPDISEILSALTSGTPAASSVSSERGHRIMQIMGELREAEDALTKELRLDE